MADWVEIQKKTYTKWANSYLRKRKIKIEDVYSDLGDGIVLVNLCGLLAKSVMSENPEPKRYNKVPKMRIHCMENLKMAFDYMRAEKVKMVNIGAEDIINTNKKIILATMWALIQRYSIDSVDMDGISGKAGLLLWCQRQTKGYPGVDVTDFSKSWVDGKAFLALLHHNGGRVDPNISDPATALQAAFDCAESQFDLEPLIDVEDMLGGSSPDEKVIMTQLAAYFKEFANRAKGENLIKAVHQAIEVTKKHDGWITEYGANSSALKSWIGDATARYQNCTEGKDGHGDTTEKIKGTIDAFYAYKRGDKATRAKDVPAVAALLAKLHSSETPNGRTLYAPAADVTPDALAASWTALKSQEDTFEASVRDSYAHFQVLDTTIAKFKSKHAKAMSWLASQRGIFTGADYGDSVVVCGSLLDNYALFDSQFKLYKEGAEVLRGWSKDNLMPLHAGHPELEALMKQLDEAIAETDSAARTYHKMLTLNKKEYAKLSTLQKPETWISQVDAVFADPDVGDTMVSNTHLLERFAEVYTDEVADHTGAVERIAMLNEPEAPEAAGVADKVSTLQAKFAELEATSKTYQGGLLSRQQELGELADQIKEFNSLCTDFIFAVDVLEEELSAPITADSLEEAEKLVEQFNEETQPAVETIKSQFRQIDGLGRKLYASKEPDAQSAFSQYDLNNLNARGGRAVKAILSYKQRLMGNDSSFYQVEKKKEELRKQFADLANRLKKYYVATDIAVKGLKGPLEEQESTLEDTLEKHEGKKAALAECAPIVQQLDEMGVINNPHTTETMDSLETEWTVLNKLAASNLATVKETLALNKQHADWTAEYEAAAKTLRDWTENASARWQNTKEGPDGHGDTTPLVKEKLDTFYEYKKKEKPPMVTKLAHTKEILGNLHASQRKNNRTLYVAPRGLGVDALEKLWADCGATEDTYEKSIRASYAHFQVLDGTIAKFCVKSAKIMEWLDARQTEFEKNEYGNSTLMAATLLENFALYEQQMELYRNPDPSYESIVNGNGIELHAEHTKLTEILKALLEKLEKTGGMGEAYKAALEGNAAEYAKLAKLMRPEGWMDGQLAFFGKKEYGSTSVEVAHLLSEFTEDFTNVVGKHRAVIAGIELNPSPPSDEPKVAERLAGCTEKLAKVDEEAAAYKAALDARKAACAAAVQQVKDYNKQAAELEYAIDGMEEELAVTPHAEDVKEAEEMVARLESTTKPALEAMKGKLGAVSEIAKQLEDSPEEESKGAFGRFKVADLGAGLDSLGATVASYEAMLARELAEEQAKEDMRKQFADGANALKKHITSTTKAMGECGGDSLEDQLAALTDLGDKEFPSMKTELAAIEPIAVSLEEKGALDNAHTPETIYSLRGEHDVLQKAFAEKKADLENSILAEKSGGLSPEQFAEIKEVFDHFDKSGDGQLDLTEFGTCTTAVGLVLSEEEIASYMAELDTSGDGQLSFDEFIAFMKDQLSHSGTSKADVMDAFTQIAGPPAAPVDGDPTPPLSLSGSKIESSFVGEYAGDVAYLIENMPKVEGVPPAAAEEGEAAAAAADSAYLCEPFVDELFTR
jgi:actinin alpha